MTLAVGSEVEIDIDRLSYDGGRGVARLDKFVIFVPDTAPLDRVRAVITVVKKNYAEGRLIEIIQASPHRRKPPCLVADRCGGCVWQHVNYDEQLRQKQGLIEFALRKLLPTGVKVPPVVASSDEFRYRDRVQVHARLTGKNLEYGFFEKGSNQLVPAKDCLISDAKLFANLNDELKSAVKGLDSKRLKKVELLLDDNGDRKIVDLSVAEGAFRQVNPAQNKLLRGHVVAEFDRKKTAWSELLDLYCGDGNFTFALAEKFNVALTGVEFSADAIARAKSRQKAAPRAGLDFVAGDVARHLKARQRTNSLAILVDPPRAGLEKGVIAELLRLSPDILVYVSCNLSTLTRDLHVLCESGFAIETVKGFDMFPQTEYVETVITLLPRANRVP